MQNAAKRSGSKSGRPPVSKRRSVKNVPARKAKKILLPPKTPARPSKRPTDNQTRWDGRKYEPVALQIRPTSKKGGIPGGMQPAELHAAVGAIVKRCIPGAKPIEAWGTKGWSFPRLRRVAWGSGTLDPNMGYVALGHRAQGPTLHIWCPPEFGILSRHRDRLAEAGFKVMVACLAYTRKTAYPLDQVEFLCREIQASLEADKTTRR